MGKCACLKHPYFPVLICVLNFGEKETYPSLHNYILSVGYVVSNGRKIVSDEMGCMVCRRKQS
jgi:hypothetical protein